jgi:HEAT repeat protein
MEPDPAEALPALLKIMNDPDPEVRHAAVAVLGTLGKAAKPAVPALAALLGDPKMETRYAAASSLARIEPGSPLVVPAFLRILKEEDTSWSHQIEADLGELGSGAKAAVPALVTRTERGDCEAAEALGKIGPDARAAVPALNGLLNRKVPAGVEATEVKRLKELYTQARVKAALALWRIERWPGAVPLLMGLLEDRTREFREEGSCVRWMTADALGNIGTAAEPAVPLLRDALQEKWLRYHAAQALGNIGPKAQAAVPALIAQLGKHGSLEDQLVAEALGRIGPPARPAVQRLASLLEVKSADESSLLATVAAAEALWKVDQQADRAVPALARVLLVKKVWTPLGWFASQYGAAKARRRAAEVLGEIGPAARAAIPGLTELAKRDEVWSVREAATAALKQIQGEAGKNAGPR